MKNNKQKDFNTWLSQAKKSGEDKRPSSRVWYEIQEKIMTDSGNSWLEKLFQRLGGKPNLQYALSLGIIIGSVFLIVSQQSNATLLTGNEASMLANEIDAKVFESQRLYEEVLNQLDQQMSTELIESDNEVIELYLEKIRTLDILIAQCKYDLEENPYNPNIHRTLFYAYNEKLINMKAVIDINKELTS